MKTPITDKKWINLEEPHGTRTDPYYWIRDVEWSNSRHAGKAFKDMQPEVQQHLLAEKEYTEHYLKAVQPEAQKIFEEIKARIPAREESVPYFDNGYWYYQRYEEGQEYPLFFRKKENLEAVEELYLDSNELVQGSKVFKLGVLSVSPDNRILAYSMDKQGNRLYKLCFKNLETGENLPQSLPNTAGDLVWAADSQHFFMPKMNAKTLRYESVERYRLDELKAEVVYYEKNPEFNVSVSLSSSQKYIFIVSESKESSEGFYFLRDEPYSKPTLFQKREEKHEYDLDHAHERFYIRSNKTNPNFDLFFVAENNPSQEWKKIEACSRETFIQDFILFQNMVVLEGRTAGTKNLIMATPVGKNEYALEHPDTGYVLELSHNRHFEADSVRFTYETPVTPVQTIEWDFQTKERKVLKTQKVGGGYDSSQYMSERRMVEARDGMSVPLTIVRRKDLTPSSDTPLYLYAYGSYGINIEPYFRSSLVSLLDRGFIAVFAHIRGSSFLGRNWYQDGKFLKKKNTFNDFVDMAKYLIDQKMTSAKNLFAKGGSAGGLLMGAVINQAPELFNGVIAAVPFVDVLTTMLDDGLPLTTEEYQEWGNPNEQEYYEYMKSYSPYDNIVQKHYPKVLATGSIHDTQVGYWEPGKWVAKLREHQLSQENPILFKIELETGHSGESGRYQAYKDLAEEYALLVHWSKEK